MSNEITMSVSGMTRTKDEKAIYILFSDAEKSAEFALPGCRMISNKGFDMVEIKQLEEYIDNEQDKIYRMAKEINPIKAMMKD